MKIVISGDAGSGKSSTADLIAEKLLLKRFSTGDLQRKVAESRGISINELGVLEAKDPKVDLEIDAKSKELGETEDNFVIDSWLAAFFIPDSFKVFLTADIDVRVKRRIRQKRLTESFDDLDTAKKSMLDREEVNRARWIKLYGFDYRDSSNYDIIIDTTDLSIDETADMIIDASRTD